MATRNEWFKSQRSGQSGGCVETKITDEAVHVRDSKNPDGPTLTFTHHEWAAFLDGANNGEFDL